ncbi:hypothetical protein EV715DRAFT_297181 [Schizophyllum commune]
MFVYTFGVVLPLSARRGRGAQGSAVCASRLLLKRTLQAMKTDVGGVVRPRGTSSRAAVCVTRLFRLQPASAIEDTLDVCPPGADACLPPGRLPTKRGYLQDDSRTASSMWWLCSGAFATACALG